ncbi:MAG: hypothetical protein DMG21_14715, partial [Acidobacteria bacterium]
PDGNFAYVTNGDDSTVSVISTATRTVVDTIRGVAAFPEGLAIRQDVAGQSCR